MLKDPDCKLSPAQIVFGRPLKDALPILGGSAQTFQSTAVRPLWRDAWAAKEYAIRARYARTYEALNEHSRHLPSLRHGDRVNVQNQVGHHPTKWDRSGTVVECRPHDQYIVKLDGTGRLSLRNRRFLRRFEAQSPYICYPSPSAPTTSGQSVPALVVDLESPSRGHQPPLPLSPRALPAGVSPSKTPSSSTPASPLPVPSTYALPPLHMEESARSPGPVVPDAATYPPAASPRRSSRMRAPRLVYDAASGGSAAPNGGHL